MKWLVVSLLAFFPEVTASSETGASCAETARCAQSCPSATLAQCVEDCATRLSPRARPYYESLQACSKKSCIESCKDAASTSCKLCVMGKCSAELSSCLVH